MFEKRTTDLKRNAFINLNNAEKETPIQKVKTPVKSNDSALFCVINLCF